MAEIVLVYTILQLTLTTSPPQLFIRNELCLRKCEVCIRHALGVART